MPSSDEYAPSRAKARRLALVTGANRGIGREFVRQLPAAGYDVVACCRAPEAMDFSGAAGQIALLPLDVSDAASVNKLAVALQGRAIDLLINNAAIRGATGGLDDLERESFLEVMAINVLGPLLVTRALLSHLRAGRGLVANISSRAGSMAEGADPEGDYAYKCSKAALNMATVKLADDTGLIVLALHPGWVKTDMGGADAEISAKDSVTGMVRLLAAAGPADSGSFRAYDGTPVAW